MFIGESQIQKKTGTYCLPEEDKLRSIRSHPAKPRRPQSSAMGSEAYMYGSQNTRKARKNYLSSEVAKAVAFSNLRRRPVNRALLLPQFSCWAWGEGDLQL